MWDVAGRSCVHCFTDEGCVVGNRVGVSPNGHYVACGSESGVVNVYEYSECMRTESPKPVKAVMNLTTAVHSLQFNSTRYIINYLRIRYTGLSIYTCLCWTVCVSVCFTVSFWQLLHRQRKMLSRWLVIFPRATYCMYMTRYSFAQTIYCSKACSHKKYM